MQEASEKRRCIHCKKVLKDKRTFRQHHLNCPNTEGLACHGLSNKLCDVCSEAENEGIDYINAC
jgi:hypothetical protein